MKKILLIIVIAFCIFQMVIMATDIDIGSPAIDRPSETTNLLRTYINENNPANATGKITSIEIYTFEGLTGCEVAIFYVVSENNLSTRSNIDIGDVPAGYSSHSVSLDVQAGDYIGIKYISGQVDREDVGAGYWWNETDQIPCTNVLFNDTLTRTISLYGTGTTVEAGVKWNGITITKWNGITITIPLNTQ